MVIAEMTATGERPVAKARIISWPLGSSSANTTADDQGRFEIMRKPGEIVLFAYSEEAILAGFMPVRADRDNATVLVSKAASITGRVIDTDGKPRARNRIGIRLSPYDDYSTQFGVSFICDDDGRFTFKGAPAKSQGEVSASHDRDGRGRTTRARTVTPFEVTDADALEIPDLIVPAEKPRAKPARVFAVRRCNRWHIVSRLLGVTAKSSSVFHGPISTALRNHCILYL